MLRAGTANVLCAVPAPLVAQGESDDDSMGAIVDSDIECLPLPPARAVLARIDRMEVHEGPSSDDSTDFIDDGYDLWPDLFFARLV